MGKKLVIKKSISDFSTKHDAERDFLTSKMFPVIMRLFNSSAGYKNLILKTLDYMMEIAGTKFDDYDMIKGISGANVGVPWNLVVINLGADYDKVPKRFKRAVWRSDESYYLCMINPMITKHSRETFVTTSNCGSLQLVKPIRVRRSVWVIVDFFDRNGEKHVVKFEKPYTGTVQHEIDHNLGMLITDRVAPNEVK